MAKPYSQITATYLSANGLQKRYVKDATGTERLHLLTEKQVKELESKGVKVR